jgi:hypothetical protein
VLGLICLNVRRRHPYTELEINEYLEEALSAMSAMVDHVTCRRYLVDLGFLKRDRAGSRYFLSPPRLECVLSGDVANSAIALLQDVLDRSARQHAMHYQIESEAEVIQGSCHCGAVEWPSRPRRATAPCVAAQPEADGTGDCGADSH